MFHKTFIWTALSLASLATAHPGENFKRESIWKNSQMPMLSLKATGTRSGQASRNFRAPSYGELPQRCCLLTPDNAHGPYFVYQEHIRSNVVENVQGVPMHLELQFIDVNTCKPASVLIDIWSCDSQDAYSGVSAAGEGGLGTTYLRSVQPTDADGVVNFDTLFPGHYQGRATHQHIIGHVGSKVLDNGTYTGGQVAHLSQLSFDQALIDTIEATAPYNTNRVAKTSNLADGFAGYAASPKYDQFPNYAMLGSGVSGGMFVWAELGIN
ncbi:hypothetical protein SCUP515_02919 [Seiridium cupressi]